MPGLILPRSARPSYHSGFARSAGESANPGLRRGLVGAWCPALGNTGLWLHDISRKNQGTFVGLDATNWANTDQGAALTFPADYQKYITFADSILPAAEPRPCSVVMRLRPADDSTCSLFTNNRGTYAPRLFSRLLNQGPSNGYLMQLYSGDWVSSANTGNIGGTWANLVITWAANDDVVFYVNGRKLSTTTRTLAGDATSGAGFGAAGNPLFSFHMDGSLSSLLIYNRVWTPNDVAQHHADPLAPFRRKPLVISIPLASGPDDLTATSISTDEPTLSSPDIGQEQDLESTDLVSGQPVLSVPTVSQTPIPVLAYLADSVLDNGLDYLTTNGTRVDLCSAISTDWSTLLTVTRGNKAGVTVGNPEDGTSGRKVVVPAVTGGTVTSTGACDYWALSDGTGELLASGLLNSQMTLTSTNNLWGLDVIDVTFQDIDTLTPLPPIAPETFSSPYSLPTGGTTITVGSDPGDDYDETELQDALDIAALDDVIILRAGDTFVGTFTLTPRAGSGWLYIISSNMVSLPGEGIRVSPSDESNMPKIVTTSSSQAALIIEEGVTNCRFVGVEIATTYALTAAVQYGIVAVGYGGAGQTDGIIFDRCWVHGTATGNNRDGIVVYEVSNFAVIDSYISDFHMIGDESHGIHLFGVIGPARIANNYIEAAGINLFIGDNGVPAIPSDIEVVNNYMSKPWSWKVGDPTYAGIHWTVKNVFEIKAASRVWIESNVLERSWIDAQSGVILVVTPRGGPIEDLTIVNNVFIDGEIGAVFNPADVTLNRIKFENNLLYRMNWGLLWAASPDGVEQVTDITIRHNTGTHTSTGNSCIYLEGTYPVLRNAIISDNLFTSGTYVIAGVNNADDMDLWCINYEFRRNAMILIGADPGYPSYYAENERFHEHIWLSSISSVGFTHEELDSVDDFLLLLSSPLHEAATDGTDVGVDTTLLTE